MKLERRKLMTTALLGGASLLVVEQAPAAPAAASTFNILPIQFTNVALDGAGLLAAGLIGRLPFGGVPLTATAAPNAADPTCPILNLQLAPINLNLLGLQVQTSAICLRITAQSGSGNLLGNLLCGLANALNGGTTLASYLAGLTSTDRGALLGAIAALLTQALQAPTSSLAKPAVSGAGNRILTLSLGPLHLNLLGLVVDLDNCAGGPVTVTITAIPGPGNLLGNLLAGLANLLNWRGGSANQIARQLQSIAAEIGRLVGALTG